MEGRWDCWGVPTGLCVDGGRWGGRLHLHEKQTPINTRASEKNGLIFFQFQIQHIPKLPKLLVSEFPRSKLKR